MRYTEKEQTLILKLINYFTSERDAGNTLLPLTAVHNHQRRLGNGLWSIKNRVVVFKDGEFLGDFDDLFEFIWKKRRFVFHEDWYDLACRHLNEYLEEKTEQYRQLVYLTVAINNRVIGSLLFQLFNDIVPLASENFLKRCKDQSNGYMGAPIHRIVKNSWIQCGGHALEPRQLPCENYVVPHDRRGVLSMCNNGHHSDNSTQFYITLESTPWMNYKYVAFGQLLQGDDVLKSIEDVPTYYQAPTANIVIVKCGEFKTRFQADSTNILFPATQFDQWKEIKKPMDILTYLTHYHEVMGPECRDNPPIYWKPPEAKVSCDSVITPGGIKRGLYSLKSDLKSYMPLSHLPDFGSDGDQGDEDYNICEPSYTLTLYSKKLYDYNVTPNSSDQTL